MVPLPVGGWVAQDSASPPVHGGVLLRVQVCTLQSCQDITIQFGRLLPAWCHREENMCDQDRLHTPA